MREQRQSITRRALLGVSASLSTLVFVGGLVACGNTTSSGGRAPLATDAVPLVVFEGLPHQQSETTLLKSELASKPTVSHGGFPFYEKQVAVPPDVADLVRTTLEAPSTLVPWSEMKLCGAFHPDWLVSLRDGSTTKSYLICFGCHEVIVDTGAASTTFDIATDAYETLRDSLSTLRTNRPRRE
jgi:hypothetical protein